MKSKGIVFPTLVKTKRVVGFSCNKLYLHFHLVKQVFGRVKYISHNSSKAKTARPIKSRYS